MLRVLVYHRIADAGETPHLDPGLVSATPDAFREQMTHLSRRYQPVSMAEIMDAFASGDSLPAEAVHVTVDDAYRDFQENAWPVLRELGIPVTVFVPTAYPGRAERAFWWDRLHRASAGLSPAARREAVQAAAASSGASDLADGNADPRRVLRDLPHDVIEAFIDRFCFECGGTPETPESPTLLDWDELRALQDDGVTFGAHTRHHVALSREDPERARLEIRQSLDDATRELGEAPRALAYPYGIQNEEVVRIAREEGCALAFTCDDGLNEPGRTDALRLRRTNITPRTTPAIFKVRMLPWFAALDRWRHRHQRARLSA